MRSESILILEEDIQLQWILKTFLESKGHTSVALDRVEKIPEVMKDQHFSVFITTEYWTNPSGLLEAIRKIKNSFPDIYVLLTTYRTLDENEYETFFQAGVDDFLEKPFSLKKIPILLNKRLPKDLPPMEGAMSVKVRLNEKAEEIEESGSFMEGRG